MLLYVDSNDVVGRRLKGLSYEEDVIRLYGHFYEIGRRLYGHSY
jgi:hypothetical protein